MVKPDLSPLDRNLSTKRMTSHSESGVTHPTEQLAKPSRTGKVFALSLGQSLNTVVVILSAMIMARVLTQSELATYRQTLLAYEIALPLLSLGLGAGIYYYLPTEKIRVRGLVVDAVLILTLMGCIYAAFMIAGGNQLLARRFSNPAIVNTLSYLIPLPLIMLPAIVIGPVLVIRGKVGQLTLYNVLANLILATFLIGACLMWKSPEALIITKVSVLSFTGFVGLYLVFNALPADSWKPNWESIRRITKFSLPLMAASMLGTLSIQMDKLIVSAMCTPSEFAVYSIGAIEVPIVGIITGSVMAVIMPDLRRMVDQGKHESAISLFRIAAKKTSLLLIPLMVILFICAEPLITTLFSEKYTESATPFRWYLLMIPMRIVVFGSFLTALGLNTTILARSAVGLLVNAILSVFFVLKLGYVGAILGTLLSLYLVEGYWCVLAISKATKTKLLDVLPFSHISALFLISTLSSLPAMLFIWHFRTSTSAVICLMFGAFSFAASIMFTGWICRFTPLNDEIFSTIKRFLQKNSRKELKLL